MATILEFKKGNTSACPAVSDPDFCLIPELVCEHARKRPNKTALICGDEIVDYATLGSTMDMVAAALQRDGAGKGSVVAICASSSIAYASVFLGALQTGAAVAPLPSHLPRDFLLTMLDDCGATQLFLDREVGRTLSGAPLSMKRISLDGSEAGQSLQTWLTSTIAKSNRVAIGTNDSFNIIYSSGSSSAPQGVVQSHAMRWAQSKRGAELGFDESAVTLCSLPLESNATLICFFAALVGSGTIVLMPRFDARTYLELAQKHRVTHCMLVPNQYQRIVELPDFDAYDLSAVSLNFNTSSPFSETLKRQIMGHWPGGLVEFYGTAEGGGVCMLEAHNYPHKLHTVGKVAPGSDVRLVDRSGNEVALGNVGEVVGRSSAMMTGYLNRSIEPSEIWWHDKVGRPFIRTGHLGKLDQDGFLTLIDRRKSSNAAARAPRNRQ